MTTADESNDFTDLEFKFIFGACSGLGSKGIAEEYGIAQDVVQHAMISVFDKVGVSSRLELMLFVRTRLNAELRRRRTG